MRIHADPDPQPCFEHYFMCFTTKKTLHDFFSLNLVKLDLDLDPDPHSEKLLDPDPHKMNEDPQPWRCGTGGIQDRMGTGKEGYRTGWLPVRRGSGQEGFR